MLASDVGNLSCPIGGWLPIDDDLPPAGTLADDDPVITYHVFNLIDPPRLVQE